MLLAVALGGCGSHQSANAARNCAAPPVGFHNAGARDFGQRWPVPNDGYYKNTVKILKSGDITWNDVPLEPTMDLSRQMILDTYLSQIAKLEPQPFTILDFDAGAPCATIKMVRKLMIRHLGCSAEDFCFQGTLR